MITHDAREDGLKHIVIGISSLDTSSSRSRSRSNRSRGGRESRGRVEGGRDSSHDGLAAGLAGVEPGDAGSGGPSARRIAARGTCHFRAAPVGVVLGVRVHGEPDLLGRGGRAVVGAGGTGGGGGAVGSGGAHGGSLQNRSRGHGQ